MEGDQEQKHACKFCKKSFPCGRSLGGHMRSHMTNTSATEKLNKRKVSSSVNGGSNSSNTYMVAFEDGGHAGYGLRENPKKTWRLSDSNDDTLRQGKICKECGKGFLSWKALFGHMRCHSERERASFSVEDDSWTAENQKLVMDSQSDNEAAAPRRRRSRRTRYKTTNTASSSFSFANASSSVSEIEQEQEEVAMCLMMLSRDVGYWGGLNSLAESSDNNSVVVEVRSLGKAKRTAEKESKIVMCNGDETVKMKKPRGKKLESGISDSENVRYERKKSENVRFDSGFLRNGVKKVESGVSINGFIGDDELKKPNLDDELEVSDAELGKDSYDKIRVKCTRAEMGKDLINEADLEFGKYKISKGTRYDSYNPELGGDSSKKARYDASDSEIRNESPQKSKFECTTCNKIFHSYQALGGHRASHKKIKGCFASRIESSENSIETDFSPDPTADSKLIKSCSNENPIDLAGPGSVETHYKLKKSEHKCPICFKVFTSGQALGGHKRSHLVGSSEARGSQTIVIQQQLPEIRDLLDLNLPAPSDEGTSGHVAFKPWWVGSDHKHEPLVGLISN